MEAKTALLFPFEIAFLNSFSLRSTKMVIAKDPWNGSLNKALHLAQFLMSAVASSLISNVIKRFYFLIVFNKTCKTKCLILTVKFDEGQTEWTTYTLSPIIIPFHLCNNPRQLEKPNCQWIHHNKIHSITVRRDGQGDDKDFVLTNDIPEGMEMSDK